MRVIGFLRADASSEAGEPPSPELLERCGRFMKEITKSGVLLATDGLQPSATGRRVRVVDGKTRVIDGPFTESKELIASYALLQVATMDEAVYWTTRFLEAIGGGECELRPLYEGCEASQGASDQEAACEAERREQAKRNAARG